MTRGRGRPKGSKTADRDQAVVIASRCEKCQSTARTQYRNSDVVTLQGSGIAPDGKPYTQVTLSPCRCLTCGQARTDRRYENLR